MIKIKTYAILKDYFTAQINLNLGFKNIDELKAYLIVQNPAAKEILNLSRFAVEDTLVNTDYNLSGDENVSIIPPSSGG